MRNALYIILYHDISMSKSPMLESICHTLPPDLFEEHLESLDRYGRLVDLTDGLERVKKNEVNEPLFSIWFDDGLSSVRRYAALILERFGVAATLGISSRFVVGKELFWRCKLSAIAAAGQLSTLKKSLRKLGYRNAMSVGDFTLLNFSDKVLWAIDEIYTLVSSQFSLHGPLFENLDGIKLLRERGWMLANHTASHYPICEGLSNPVDAFMECEDWFKEKLSQETNFWVIPFEHSGKEDEENIAKVKAAAKERYIVRVGNRTTSAKDLEEGNIFRFAPSLCRGNELLSFLKRGG